MLQRVQTRLNQGSTARLRYAVPGQRPLRGFIPWFNYNSCATLQGWLNADACCPPNGLFEEAASLWCFTSTLTWAHSASCEEKKVFAHARDTFQTSTCKFLGNTVQGPSKSRSVKTIRSQKRADRTKIVPTAPFCRQSVIYQLWSWSQQVCSTRRSWFGSYSGGWYAINLGVIGF